MKKLVACGLMGAMLMAGQGIAFASGEKVEMESIKSIPAMTLTAAEAEVNQEKMDERIKEICETLELNYEEMKGKSLEQVFAALTEAQFDELAKSEAIEVMGVTAATATTEEVKMGKIEAVKSIPATMATAAVKTVEK